MSGRKSCEVAAVLKQGESVRKITDGIFSTEINECYKKYRAGLEDEIKIKNFADGTTVELDDAASKMFGDKGSSLMKDFQSLKKNISAQKTSDDGKSITTELSMLDAKLSAADSEAEKIRNAIRNKKWYCDDEYNQAQNLLATYERLRDERVNLERHMKKLLTAENQKLSSMRSMSEQLKNLAEQIKSMNETAKKRLAADSSRNELRGALNGIDADSAEKFFAAEYETLKKNISAAISASDDSILASFNKNYSAVADFQRKLAERVALWHKQKNDAESLFAQMEHSAAESFVDPVDYYNGEKNPQKINLFDYLKTFGGKDFGGEYKRKRDEAASLIRDEKFIESMQVISSTIDFVENTRQEGLKLQESMLKKTELAGAIQDVMSELSYDTALEIINDNPNDGFKITCRVGDETINFQNVNIDDNGKIIVDINHEEGTASNCANSWDDISQHLKEVGIPLTDVRMAGGKSVLFRETIQTPEIEQQQLRR